MNKNPTGVPLDRWRVPGVGGMRLPRSILKIAQSPVLGLAEFLRPDPELVAAIKYCLGHYAQRHGIVLHAICVMSTQFHFVAFDERGHRRFFLREVNRGIANVVKSLRGWRGPLFRPKPVNGRSTLGPPTSFGPFGEDITRHSNNGGTGVRLFGKLLIVGSDCSSCTTAADHLRQK